VRIIAIAPGSKVLYSRLDTVQQAQLDVTAVVMMRDLVQAAKKHEQKPQIAPAAAAETAVVVEARSEGRAVLALNSAAFGAYIGFALQRAGGSDDPRLTYPLIALGTGVGLGASMIIADEWDVGVGDAWYVSAGTWWPGLAGLLLASSYGKDDAGRLIIGLGSAVGGVGLATVSLMFGDMNDGGAVMAHSGGALGLLLGGVGQLIVDGKADHTPTRGMGYGAAAGVLAAGTVARFIPEPTASRILLVDLGAGLGGLTGAALASPLIFGDPNEKQNRIWLSSIAVGMIGGGTAGYLITRPSPPEKPRTPSARWLPGAGPIGVDVAGKTVNGISAFGVW
jgi:hypothetical protein